MASAGEATVAGLPRLEPLDLKVVVLRSRGTCSRRSRAGRCRSRRLRWSRPRWRRRSGLGSILLLGVRGRAGNRLLLAVLLIEAIPAAVGRRADALEAQREVVGVRRLAQGFLVG